MSRLTLALGSGGQIMQDWLHEVVLKYFDAPELRSLEDSACVHLPGEHLAISTDSFVVDPLEFPGGDIGRLAVFGSVNDVAVGGATPAVLSCGLILEEGFDSGRLERLLASAAGAAREAGVRIVTGDTKVVPRGAADGLYINTTAIGRLPAGRQLSITRAQPGDSILLSGNIGQHGAAILAAREDLQFSAPILSDCANLAPMCRSVLAAAADTRCMRDITRGGLATVLNEIARASGVGMEIDEPAVPVDPVVQGLCELLGLDPLELACEGRLVAIVPAAATDRVLQAIRKMPDGEKACRIGEVVAGHCVSMRSSFGGQRVIALPIGELLPRIC